MRKKMRLVIGVLTLLLGGLIVTTALAGGSAEPGSIDDPIVTKSYVDEQFFLLNKSLQKSINNQLGVGAVAPIIVETLTAGDKLIGKAGTEIIVRSGTVVAHGENSNGIPDVTAGVDIAIGKQVPLNHQLIIPRDDGRGIKASTSSEGISYIMVRGQYEVIKAN